MSDQPARLAYLLAQLEGGQISTADAAREVRGMTFPVSPPKTPYQLIEAAALRDIEMPEPGSFFEVWGAYVTGRITKAQYAALAEAAAEAMRERRVLVVVDLVRTAAGLPGHRPCGVVGDDQVTQAQRSARAERHVVVPALRHPVAGPQAVDRVRLAPVPAQRSERLVPVTDHVRHATTA